MAAGGNDIGKCDVTEEELGLSDDSTKKITVSRLDDFRIQETVINDIAANSTDDVNPVTAKAVADYTYQKSAIDTKIEAASGNTYSFNVTEGILNFNSTKGTSSLINSLVSEDNRLTFSQESGSSNIKISVVYPPIFDLVG